MKAPTAAILGAGPAGLFAAHLLRREGFAVSLFEGHSKPGGCASFFGRKTEVGRVVFDAGATVLNGLSPGNFLDRLVKSFGVELKAFIPIEKMKFQTTRYFELDAHSSHTFITSLADAFPTDAKVIRAKFPSLFRSAEAVRAGFERIPHLPIEAIQDLRLNLPGLPALLPSLPLLAKGRHQNFKDLLDAWHFSDDFQRWVDMNLLITLQSDAKNVLPLYGAMALAFYTFDAGVLPGGMRSLFDPMLKTLQACPDARVFTRSPVQSIDIRRGKYCVVTAKNEAFGDFDYVLTSLPRFNSAQLFTTKLFEDELTWTELKPEMWGAVVAYVVVKDAPEFAANPFNLHSQMPSGDAYMSFSLRNDIDRVPERFRAITISTHANLNDWPSQDYDAQKAAWGARLMAHLTNAYPSIDIKFAEFGTPKTFAHYTRRIDGTVGGIPLTRAHSLFDSPSQRTCLPRVFQIGDTSFPGQSVYGSAVGACAAVEKLLDSKIRV